MIPTSCEYLPERKGWEFNLIFPYLKDRHREPLKFIYFAPEIEYKPDLGYRNGFLKIMGHITVTGFVRMLPAMENILARHSENTMFEGRVIRRGWQGTYKETVPGTFQRHRMFDLESGKSYRPNDAPANSSLTRPGEYGIIGSRQKMDESTGNPAFIQLGFMDDLRDVGKALLGYAKNPSISLSLPFLVVECGITEDDIKRLFKAKWLVIEKITGNILVNQEKIEKLLKTDPLSATFEVNYILRAGRWIPDLVEQFEKAQRELEDRMGEVVIKMGLNSKTKTFEELEQFLISHTIPITNQESGYEKRQRFREIRKANGSSLESIVTIRVQKDASTSAKTWTMENPKAMGNIITGMSRLQMMAKQGKLSESETKILANLGSL